MHSLIYSYSISVLLSPGRGLQQGFLAEELLYWVFLLPVPLAGLQEAGTDWSLMHRELGSELREI